MERNYDGNGGSPENSEQHGHIMLEQEEETKEQVSYSDMPDGI